jgi:hypothetical protein
MPLGDSGRGLVTSDFLRDGVLPSDHPLLAGMADGDLVGKLVSVVLQAGTATALGQGKLEDGFVPLAALEAPDFAGPVGQLAGA